MRTTAVCLVVPAHVHFMRMHFAFTKASVRVFHKSTDLFTGLNRSVHLLFSRLSCLNSWFVSKLNMADNADGGLNDELMQLTQEAFKLATTACHFDKNQNVVGACDYYDKCLLNMDEVMNKLNPDSAEWKKLYDIRTKYDDRMEFLREHDTASYSLTTLALGKSDGKSSSGKLPRNRRKLSEAETDFKDVDWTVTSQESAPEDVVEVTYWLLRNIRTTMDQGGFLTKDIFVPKRIWIQNDVKFSGIGAKTAAFDIIVKLIGAHTEALYLSLDEDSMDLAEAGFGFVYEELVSLQNNLSKPFPYIKELSPAAASGGAGKEESPDPRASESSVKAGSGRSGSLTSFVSSFGKNVRKYAEVGFQRLVVALPSKLSAEELEEYVQLVTKLCDKCQVFNTWYTFVKSSCALDSSGRGINQNLQVKLDSIRGSLVLISAAVRDIVVEILFRDLEYLLDKYMTDMRKGLCRMYWDDELDAHES